MALHLGKDHLVRYPSCMGRGGHNSCPCSTQILESIRESASDWTRNAALEHRLCALVQLKQNCPSEFLEKLKQQMEALEPEFDYDKDYINECMGWTPSHSQNGSAPSSANGHAGKNAHASCDGCHALKHGTANTGHHALYALSNAIVA